MPQQQRIRDTKTYNGDNETTWGYPPYAGQVGYCNHCQNYNDDTAESCEICGGKVRLIPLSNASAQPDIKGAKNYSFDDQQSEAQKNGNAADKHKYRALNDEIRANNFSGHYLKPVANHLSEHLRQMVFVPATAPDNLTNQLSYALALKGELYLHGDSRTRHGNTSLHRVQQPVLQPNSYVLDALKWGGRLYIVGHGNAGGAIGNHDDKFGANSLVQLLIDERLPKKPKAPVTLWLFACATGAAVNPGYYPVPVYRKDPFVLRFSKALWDKGFSNYYVVGIAGFVGTDADICVDYSVDDNKSELRKWRLTSTEERIVYHATSDGYAKVHGGEFIQQTDFRWLGNPKKWDWTNTQLKVKAKNS
ncbi:hypothetical protein BO221_31525 [Archangium sp. Cb G35]|uniref:hypothetical protein n=1 Tax=Archangium sp. Cb G35 TaxID=1920190 RepID=UPI000936D9C6|nr:hypothetical protein [Archangium sp. Cb G35]OJT20527.1 hypothetical protein BO221_31525 [Archangium sp. Cb G35]